MEVKDLPEELWMTVMGFLDGLSLVRLRVTNSFLRRLALDDRWTREVAAYRRTADYLRKRRLAMIKHHGSDFRPAPLPSETSIGPVPRAIRPQHQPTETGAWNSVGMRAYGGLGARLGHA